MRKITNLDELYSVIKRIDFEEELENWFIDRYRYFKLQEGETKKSKNCETSKFKYYRCDANFTNFFEITQEEYEDEDKEI